MSVIGPWFRKTNRRRGKWHAGKHVASVTVSAVSGPFTFKRYTALCGARTFPFDRVEIAPEGDAPDDEHGVCLHCLRAIEMHSRADEARQ